MLDIVEPGSILFGDRISSIAVKATATEGLEGKVLFSVSALCGLHFDNIGLRNPTF